MSTRLWIMLPIGLSAIGRGLTLIPTGPNPEALPAPLLYLTGPWFWAIAWILGGLLMVIGAFIGHKVIIFQRGSGKAKLRLDDLGILLIIMVTLSWGLSYYTNYIISVVAADWNWQLGNRDNYSGRNFLPWAIASFAVWYGWFSRRTRAEVAREISTEEEIDKARYLDPDDKDDEI